MLATLQVVIVPNTSPSTSTSFPAEILVAPPLLAIPALPTPSPDAAIRTTALRVLQWAHRNSLLSADAFFPGEEFDREPVFEPSANALLISTLRSKHVRQVGINLPERRITVFLSKALPAAKVLGDFPKKVDGFNLRFQQGDSENVNPAAIAATTMNAVLHHANGSAYYTCGSSISVGNSRAAGTLGCLLRDGAGKLYGLSNNHVSGGCGNVPAGMPILAPGVLDVHPLGPQPFTIGLHARQLDMTVGDPSSVDTTRNQDAAVFTIVNPDSVSSMQRDAYDTPTVIGDLVPGMQVEKAGRTSGFTRGTVHSEIVGPFSVNYKIDEYGFTGVIYFEPMFLIVGIGDRFSEGGDSGSLVTALDANGQRTAVGIIVAGLQDNRAPGGTVSVVMPIRPILNQMALSLVSNHNV